MPYLSTIASFGFDDLPTGEMLELYRELGCVASQFYRNPANMLAPAEAKRIADDAGLPFDSLHGLFGPNLDPSSPDQTLRKLTIETYLREADAALIIGGPMVVVHPAPPNLPADTSPHDHRQRRDALVRSLHDLSRIGDATGVTFLIENLPPQKSFCFDAVMLGELVRDAAQPRVRLCFDTGHANMHGDPVEALGACADLVALCHINDNAGDADAHLFPGDGTCPWDRLGPSLAALPADVSLMLELFPTADALRQRIDAGFGQRLRDWFGLVAERPA